MRFEQGESASGMAPMLPDCALCCAQTRCSPRDIQDAVPATSSAPPGHWGGVTLTTHSLLSVRRLEQVDAIRKCKRESSVAYGSIPPVLGVRHTACESGRDCDPLVRACWSRRCDDCSAEWSW